MKKHGAFLMKHNESVRSVSNIEKVVQVGCQTVLADTTILPRWLYLFYGFIFKIRGLMAGILLFAMFFVTRKNWGNDALNWAIGLPLFAAAVLLRIRSQQYLKYRLRDHSALTTAGPYAYVRNPVYIANIMGLGALCILCNLYWMAPIAVGWAALVYHLSVRFEEMNLIKCHGEPYRSYLKCVPRWIPRRSPSRDVVSGRAGFWRAARVEWQNLLLLLVPLGKNWTFRSHGGSVHAVVERLVNFVLAHTYVFLVVLAIGVVCLAAMNLVQHRSSRRRKAKQVTGEEKRPL